MHKLFARQLAKASAASGEVAIEALGELVGAAYDQADRDRRRTDRSISLMIEELDQLNRGLERLVAERTAALREREDELRAQNLLFDTAINNMSPALMMFEASGRLLVCNARYAEMYGLSPDVVKPGITVRELLGLRNQNSTFPDDPDQCLAQVMAEVAAGKTINRLLELPDGRTIEVVMRPMPNGGWGRTRT